MRTHGKYLQIGKLLIPRPPMIMEQGERAHINEENSIHLMELIKYIWWNRELLDKVKIELKIQEDFDTIVYILAELSRMYAQEKAGFTYLKEKLWDDVAWEKIDLANTSDAKDLIHAVLRRQYLDAWEKMWTNLHPSYQRIKIEELKDVPIVTGYPCRGIPESGRACS